MDYMSHRPSETPSKGIIVLEDGIPVIYPDRTLRSVHPDPAQRVHAMSYRIVNDGQGLHRTTESGDTWEHFRYTFTYRYQGRTPERRAHRPPVHEPRPDVDSLDGTEGR